MADLIRCPRCGGHVESVGRDVLTGEEVLRCGAYHDCGWRRSGDDDGYPDERQAGLFDEAAG